MELTDAWPTGSGPVNILDLDLSILKKIEQDLTTEEQISILFLILPDSKCLNDILYALKTEKSLLSEFVYRVPEWPEKLIEALCIIKNHRILINLGLSIEHQQNIYVPRIPSISSKINAGAKILYCLFDQLDNQKFQSLLNSIYKDIPRDIRVKTTNLPEIHALYWQEIGQISIKPGRGDLKFLLKHLKVLGLFDSPIYSDIEQYTENDAKIPTNNPEKLEKSSKTTLLPCKFIIKKGLCIIINEENFPNTEYETRYSSKIDTLELQKTFKGLNFNVITFVNVKEADIYKIIEQHSSKNPGNYDCLTICLLSHGYSGGFISHDGKEISFSAIENRMCSDAYQDAVKLLIIQACQGTTKALAKEKSDLTVDGMPENSQLSAEPIVENYRSFFQFVSTMNNCISVRHRHNGSWFIQELCSVLQAQKAPADGISIHQWSNEVRRRVQAKRGDLGDGKVVAQLPESKDRLIHDVYFPVYSEKHILAGIFEQF